MTATAVKPNPLGTLLTRLTGDEKHAPSAYSTLDVLWVRYDRTAPIRRACEPRSFDFSADDVLGRRGAANRPWSLPV